ncbi:hypothetical protein H5410_058652 [Solanum commersonii]|uniref:Uncharacterized protein n=1 Tax=Solanum commersonii TaxID=4109 RepID=A0A9J5WU91_SOLCO|nr:hypothetical protein H5410_058652 [Solanum commersonii]
MDVWTNYERWDYKLGYPVQGESGFGGSKMRKARVRWFEHMKRRCTDAQRCKILAMDDFKRDRSRPPHISTCEIILDILLL